MELVVEGLGQQRKQPDRLMPAPSPIPVDLSTESSPRALPPRPYPGLRPFEPREDAIFFGREPMIDEIIDLLAQRCLLLVHGSSGAGKSSMVLAGVLPRLSRQHRRHGWSWGTASMRPGGGPLWNLARALAKLEGETPSPSRVDELRLSFDRSDANLAGIVAQLAGMERRRLCLLIDQFEELFRYARETSREEARLFVNLITGVLQEDSGSPVRVILTMRSEYLGECARLPGLAGVVNSAQYLLPRMETASLHRAIRRPAELYGGEVTVDLADRLIADVQGSQDELPLIQHGLMRLWDLAGATAGDPHSPRRLDLPHYEAHGPLARMLDRHAEEVAAAAASDERGRRVVEEMFRALTDINSDRQAIRRPQSLKSLIAVTKAERGQLVSILDRFRSDSVSFITPYAPARLDDETMIDISHEALIRCWNRLAGEQDGWLHSEFRHGLIWRSLLSQAELFERNPRTVLGPATTEDREHWLEDRTPAWSERYGGGWNRVQRLISASRKEANRRRRRDRAMIWTLGLFAGVSLTAFLIAGHQWLEALNQAEISRRQERQIAHQLSRATAALAEGRLNDLDLTPDSSLTARQRNALWKLAMAEKAVQLSFIAALSASPEDMVRVAAGFKAVSRSLGFQSPSPDQAEKFFLAALAALEWPAREPKTARSATIAFQTLASKLTEAQAQRALAQVLNQFDRTTDPDVLRALAQATEALPVKLTEAQAQQALAPVLDQIGQSTDSNALHVLAQAFQALAGKLSGAQAQQALDLVIKRLGQTTNSEVLRALAQAIPALAVKVTEPPAQQALAAVIKQIDQTTDPDLMRALVQAIQALADKLTGAQAQQALAQMLKQFDRTTDPDVFQALAQAIEALPVQPTDAQAQQALDAITKQIEPSNIDQAFQIQMMLALLAQDIKNVARRKVSFLPAWAWRIQALASKLSETQAQQALNQLLKQFDRTTDPSVLRALGYSIGALPAKLTEAQARQALAPLLKQLGQTTNPEVLKTLAQAIQVLASKLSEAQAQQALAPLLKQFGQTTNSDVLRALAQATQALASKLSATQAQQALAPLLRQFGQTTNSDVLRALAQAIPALAVKVTEPPAQQALAAVIKQIDQTTDPYLVRALAQAIQALASKLSEAQAQQALAAVLRQVDRTTDPDVLWALTQLIEAVPAQLTEAQAQRGLAPVLQKINQSTRSDALQVLAGASKALAGKLTEAQAQQALAPVLQQISQTTRSDALRVLAQAVQSLAGNLTTGQAQQAASVAASSLAWAATEDEAADWARALVGLLPRAKDQDETRELILAIVYPTAAGSPSEVVLETIRARHSDAPAKEAGTAASLAWIAETHPDLVRRPICPPPPQPTSLSGLRCPVAETGDATTR